MTKTHYSCAELADLKLPGMPSTERRLRDLVEREAWLSIEQKSRGRNGVTRLYAPPERIAKLIAARDGVVTAQPCGPDWTITLSVTLPMSDAAALTAWLEKRRARRG